MWVYIRYLPVMLTMQKVDTAPRTVDSNLGSTRLLQPPPFRGAADRHTGSSRHAQCVESDAPEDGPRLLHGAISFSLPVGSPDSPRPFFSSRFVSFPSVVCVGVQLVQDSFGLLRSERCDRSLVFGTARAQDGGRAAHSNSTISFSPFPWGLRTRPSSPFW